MPRSTSREQELLLRLVGDGADRRHHAEMVLRDLPDARVGSRDDRDHPGQGDVGHVRPAERLGHVDRPQAALRERRRARPPAAAACGHAPRHPWRTRPPAAGRPRSPRRRSGSRGPACSAAAGRARPRDALDLALDAHVRLLVRVGWASGRAASARERQLLARRLLGGEPEIEGLDVVALPQLGGLALRAPPDRSRARRRGARGAGSWPRSVRR